MRIGEKVQVWDSITYECLGWGTIIQIGVTAKDIIKGTTPEPIPLIQLETGEKIWGDRCDWISEKKAIETGVRLFRDIFKEPGS